MSQPITIYDLERQTRALARFTEHQRARSYNLRDRETISHDIAAWLTPADISFYTQLDPAFESAIFTITPPATDETSSPLELLKANMHDRLFCLAYDTMDEMDEMDAS